MSDITGASGPIHQTPLAPLWSNSPDTTGASGPIHQKPLAPLVQFTRHHWRLWSNSPETTGAFGPIQQTPLAPLIQFTRHCWRLWSNSPDTAGASGRIRQTEPRLFGNNSCNWRQKLLLNYSRLETIFACSWPFTCVQLSSRDSVLTLHLVLSVQSLHSP